ncbi:hypothetical protein [Micromonospora cremea]|uniref:Uncharacterized protein n=1 Tax=Micromonospora cremea TaxID=709881 RepID=A0A1N6ANZ6_9ACTN|nr:hypothetical protein [Micromonospora cremea]SIN35746.1 hypothetical protein SAMN04489832_5857 [Micromonospora cremea]
MTPEVPQIKVAGRIIEDSLTPFIAYCQRNGGTIRNYDWLADSSLVLTPKLIKATRSPWMGSRISHEEGLHLLRLSETAPWQAVADGAHLGDADPVQVDGLYARALQLYHHFYDALVRGIAVAKVSKRLYLMRPALFPILDSRLLNLYWKRAKQAARDLAWLQGRQAAPRRVRRRPRLWRSSRLRRPCTRWRVGWAHDRCRPDRHRASDAASNLARESGDQQLTAQVYASLSHLASHKGNANDALAYSISDWRRCEGRPRTVRSGHGYWPCRPAAWPSVGSRLNR